MADKVGVYVVSGTMMKSPGPRPGTGKMSQDQEALLKSTAISSSYNSVDNFVSSSVIASQPPQTQENAIETKQLNTFFSGTESLEYFVSGTSSIPVAWKDLYYSKYPGIGTLNPLNSRLNYAVYKHVADLNDVQVNPPSTAPSMSAIVAPLVAGPGAQASSYLARLGSAYLVTENVITVTNWRSYIYSGTNFATTGVLQTALTANLLGAQLAGGYPNYNIAVIGVSFSGANNDLHITASNTIPVYLQGTWVDPTSIPLYLYSWVPLVSDVSGAFVNSSAYNPASIDITVPTLGALKDLKAWVEFIHDERQTGSSDVLNDNRGLKNVQIALRSPNTSFRSAHPLWNGRENLAFPINSDPTLTGTGNVFGDLYYGVPPILQNSYLLWDGHGVNRGIANALDPSTINSKYHEFDRDVDMRTVFWDGAAVNNPRDISSLHGTASNNTPQYPYSWFTGTAGGVYYQSPTWGVVNKANLGWYLSPVVVTGNTSLSGAMVPWMLDQRIHMCGFEGQRSAVTATNEGMSLDPPPGWISGRGGMAEWQTATSNSAGTGVSFIPPGAGGAVFIRPSTQAIHLMGGRETSGTTVPGYGSWHVHYNYNVGAQLFLLDSDFVRNGNNAPEIGSVPTYLKHATINYFNVSVGTSSIANGSTERILYVGGSGSSAYYHSGAIIGFWPTSGSEDITYSSASVTSMPEAVFKHCATVINDKIYVAGGLKSNLTSFTGVFEGTIDQQTGKPTSWDTHLFPPISSRSVTRVLFVGGHNTVDTVVGGALTSSDNGLTFVEANNLGGLAASTPKITIKNVVHTTASQYIAVGYSGTDYKWAATNDDGVTWWTGSTGYLPRGIVSASNGKLYATANDKILSASRPVSFGDTMTWGISTSTLASLTNICMGSGILVAVGWETGSYYSYKSDTSMTTWSSVGSTGYIGPFAGYNWQSVVWGPEGGEFGQGAFVAVGLSTLSTNAIAYSANGNTWTTIYDATHLGALISVAYGNGKYVAIGNNGRVNVSSDGINWSYNQLPSGDALSRFKAQFIIWTGSRFIATFWDYASWSGHVATYAGISYYSTDGSSWTEISMPNTTHWNAGAAYIGEEVVSLGESVSTFFDIVPDATGTLRNFAWTTFNNAGTLITYRYEMSGAGNWSPVSDAGIIELFSSQTGHYNPVVDDQHRVWAVDGNSAKYSTISWDAVNNRPAMSPAVQSGFGQSFGTLGVSPSMSIVFSSGVMATLNSGTTAPEVAATAFVGLAPNADEFNTVGYQLGPTSIRPVYPILDDIVVVKNTDEVVYNPNAFSLSSPHAKIVGSRPGLRNTEIFGTWRFLFGCSSSFNDSLGFVAENSSSLWVRQVRLEMIYDAAYPAIEQLSSKNRRFSKPSIVPGREGLIQLSLVSGSCEWDVGLNSVDDYQSPDYGRSVGITADTSSLPDYAVLTFITGNLYNSLASSNPSWFLTNSLPDVSRPSGIPYIPDSSMSLGTGSAEQIDTTAAQEMYNATIGVQTIINNANSLTDFLNRQGYTRSTLARWEAMNAAQASGSSSGYFPGL